MPDEKKTGTTARAAAAADELMHGGAPKKSRDVRPERRPRGERAQPAPESRKDDALTPEQRLQVVEEELRVAARQRIALHQKLEALEHQQPVQEKDAELQEEVRVLRAQVDDLVVQVRAARQQKRGWRFGVSFDLLSLV